MNMSWTSRAHAVLMIVATFYLGVQSQNVTESGMTTMPTESTTTTTPTTTMITTPSENMSSGVTSTTMLPSLQQNITSTTSTTSTSATMTDAGVSVTPSIETMSVEMTNAHSTVSTSTTANTTNAVENVTSTTLKPPTTTVATVTTVKESPTPSNTPAGTTQVEAANTTAAPTEYDYEVAITNAIFMGYQSTLPPSTETFSSNKSNIRIILQRLRHIDKDHNTLGMDMLIQTSWFDDRLQWDSSKYGGVSVVHVQPDDVWTPEVRYQQSFAHYKEILKQTTDSVSIDSNGLVTLRTPGHPVDIPCETDLYFFPFDYQDCSITVLSFPVSITTRPQPNVFTSSSSVDMIPNIEWEVTSESSRSNATQIWNRVYTKSTFTFRFARRSISYWYTVILPYIVFTLLPLCVFLVPVSSPSRLTFAMIQMVGFFVSMLFNKGIVPFGVTGDNEVPVIAQFFVSVLCRMMLSILLACWSYGAYEGQGSGRHLGYCKRNLVVGCIGRVLGFGKESKLIFGSIPNDEEKNNIQMEFMNIPASGESTTDIDSLIKQDGKLHSRLTLNDILLQIKEAKRVFTSESEIKREKLKIHLEWQLYASILDRLFLILIFASIVAVAVLIPLQYHQHLRIK